MICVVVRRGDGEREAEARRPRCILRGAAELIIGESRRLWVALAPGPGVLVGVIERRVAKLDWRE